MDSLGADRLKSEQNAADAQENGKNNGKALQNPNSSMDLTGSIIVFSLDIKMFKKKRRDEIDHLDQ